MKRDMDLVRCILLEIEKESYIEHSFDLDIRDYPKEVVDYHLVILNEAGLIKVLDMSGEEGVYLRPIRLTWQGHEFLETVRNDTQWGEVKKVMSKTGGIAFEVAKLVGIELAKQAAFRALSSI
jgi:DNA-binding transcriptional ArsR family regulator